MSSRWATQAPGEVFQLECVIERNTKIDVLRGMAVLGVLLIHTQNAWYLGAGNELVEQGRRLRLRETWPGLFSTPVTFGFLGLNLFFILSGLCIHLWTLKRHTVPLRNGFPYLDFMKRRFRRLYPVYAAAIAFSLVCLGAAEWIRLNYLGQQEISTLAKQVVRQTLQYLSFTHTLTRETFSGYNPPLYTMAIEMHFYLLYPLVLWGFRYLGTKKTFGVSIVISLFSTAIGLRSSEIGGDRLIMDSVLVRWPEWILGCLIAEQWWQAGSVKGWGIPSWKLAMGSGVCLLSGLFIQLWYRIQLNVLWSAGLVGVIIYYLGRPQQRLGLLERFLCHIGLISYSIYLVHYPLLRFGALLLPPDPELLLIHLPVYCLLVLGILAVGYVFFKYFERPTLGSGAQLKASSLSLP